MIEALAVLLIVLPPADWAAASILGYLSIRHPDIVVLRERAVTALVLATCATLAGILGWIALGVLPGEEVAVGLLAVILIGLSIPALNWLWLAFSGAFTDEEGE